MKFYFGLLSLHIFLLKMRVTPGACIKSGCLAQRPLCRKVNLLASCEARRPLCHKVNLLSCVARRPLFHKVSLPRCEARRRLFITGLNSMIYIIYILYYLVFTLYFLVFALCIIKLHGSRQSSDLRICFHVYYYDEKQVTFK